MVWVLGEVRGFNHVFHIGQEVHDFQGVILNRQQRWFSVFQSVLQPVPELGKGFCFLLADFHLGNHQKIHIPDPVAGVGQFIPILVFVKLTGSGIAFGIVGIFEIIKIKYLNITAPLIIRVQWIHPTSGPKIIHEAHKISVPNGKFKGSARWQQGLGLGDHGFQLDHFIDMIIRQNREAVLVEVKGLFHPFFNARVKGRSKNQGVVRVCAGDCVYPFHISQAVFVWASIKDFNPAVGNSHSFTPFTMFLKASKPSGYRMKPKHCDWLICFRFRF